MNYNIRKATLSDLEDILAIQSNYEHTLISKNALHNDLTNNSSIYFVATNSQNDIVGVIGGLILVDHLDIEIVITKKELTRNNIASYLLEHLIHYSRENKLENIFLEVRSSNIPAINLYTKFGFVQISTRKNYYTDNNEDALIYILKI